MSGIPAKPIHLEGLGRTARVTYLEAETAGSPAGNGSAVGGEGDVPRRGDGAIAVNGYIWIRHAPPDVRDGKYCATRIVTDARVNVPVAWPFAYSV